MVKERQKCVFRNLGQEDLYHFALGYPCSYSTNTSPIVILIIIVGKQNIKFDLKYVILYFIPQHFKLSPPFDDAYTYIYLLTGYKTHVSCDKTAMSRVKNIELLNVTCRTT